ncbi:ATP-dependent zinc metalloprotease FtsH [Brevundimonas sp. 2R-24]|uniref:ATP-dependent zinc metalloprotease FtsH n=1 Tax=Peiella sedimenti TaxID=3061083 RepID=A0ABT8SM60_9CAUL|nr:ATP-dependent zinc metalloprotease FtsH [Caulobacteraceae bacterium XZ-24]
MARTARNPYLERERAGAAQTIRGRALKILRSLAIWLLIIMALVALYGVMGPGFAGKSGAAAERPGQISEISYSQLMQRVEAGQVKSVQIKGDTLQGVAADDSRFRATTPYPNEGLIEALQAAGVQVQLQTTRQSLWVSLLLGVLPLLLVFGLFFWMMNRVQGGARGAMGFGKSKAKLLTEHKGRKTFDDVAGVDEAKDELAEIVEFLKDPQKFQRLGGKIPKGALLVGPPGTGKTLLARAIAGEAGVPFFTISGSDFVEMFVGVGASRVRDMFEQAKKNAPCIVFIDEIDAVGRHRGAGLGGGNDEREQTLNQLLVEMDGFESNEGIILIAATNRPDVLDPALLRPGRFDRQVVVPNPDVSGREKILRVHMKNVPLAADVNVKVIARGTPGFSGADLANLVNEAALLAARKNRKMVTHRDFEEAKDKVLMGAERRSMAMNDEEKKLTAYHEGGHALVALTVPSTDPVHKATIVPRGRALGMVMQLPEGDRYSMKYQQMVSRLAIMMAGRVAEEIVFGKDNITSGASSDIKAATDLARAMVTRWGFSDKLGYVAYGDNQDEVFLGHSVARTQNVSEETARIIDAEVKRLVGEGHDEARRILTERRDDLETLAKALLEYETLSGDEIRDLLEKGLPPNRDVTDAPSSGPSVAVPITPKEAPDFGPGLAGATA